MFLSSYFWLLPLVLKAVHFKKKYDSECAISITCKPNQIRAPPLPTDFLDLPTTLIITYTRDYLVIGLQLRIEKIKRIRDSKV